MFCFGLQSIARFINTNASYFNTHRLEAEAKILLKLLNLSRKIIIIMSFTGLGRSVLGETVPSTYSQGQYSRPRAQFLPIRTSHSVNNIMILRETDI